MTIFHNKRPWIMLVIIAAICALVVLADRGGLPVFVYSLYAFPWGDKAGHFLLMGLLAYALNVLFPGQPKRRNFPWLFNISWITILLVTIEEISQLWFVSRTFSFADLGFSILGILCADGLVRRWRS